jgi:hypothetical protein
VKTSWVVFETVQSGEPTPGCQGVTIYPGLGESFESMFKALRPECVYRGVFDDRNAARCWVDNWKTGVVK